MRTGLKTFLKKIFNNINNPKFIYGKINWDKFPEKPANDFLINLKLNSVEKDLKDEIKNNNLNYLLGKPHPLILKIYHRFLKYNPNNLGNWSNGKRLGGTKKIEQEVILTLINLYNGVNKNIEGYITSGATEGNIFSCWLGREYLKNKIKGEISLLKTSLTHYSVDKAGRLCLVDQHLVCLNNNLEMDPRSLFEKINNLYQKGYRGFLICLTIGYTVSGTSDNIEKINKVVNKLKIIYKDIDFFIWLDAASDGWIRIFLDGKFSPFKYNNIQTFLSDFHKFGMVPYPSGFILYRRKLRKFIEKEIPYLEEKDNTLLGSRQGVVALAIWYLIWCFGKQGFNSLYKNLIKEKEIAIKRKFIEYKKLDKEIKLFTDKFSLTAGFFSKKKLNGNFKIKLELLINKKIISFYIDKYYFLPIR